MYYSRISPKDVNIYTFSLYIALFTTFSLRLYGFFYYNGINHKINLIPRTEAKIATSFFNIPVWNLKTEEDETNY